MAPLAGLKSDGESQDLALLPLSGQEQEKDEQFQDAFEVIPAAPTMSLLASLEECTTGLYLFLNNRFSEALRLIYPWSQSSLYHALMHSVLMVVKAALTLEPQDIEAGLLAAKSALRTCGRFRRRSRASFGRLVSLREEELHAELCYAESLLLKSAASFIQDDSLLSYLRGGLAIGSSYQILRDCQRALAQMPAPRSETFRHLAGGVQFGLGLFNLLLPLVPPKTLRLLSVSGQAGDREAGLQLLGQSAAEPHLSSVLSALLLLFYHGYVDVALGPERAPDAAVERLLRASCRRFPNCVLLKFFRARFCVLAGQLAEARLRLHECVFVQSEWTQVHHLCYWELMWCSVFLQNWRQAFHYARLLARHSRWSRAVYVYSKAALLALLPADFARLVGEDASSLFLQVASLRIKVFGTSVPIEKFIAEKGQRYGATTGWYPAQPMLELIYAWSGFRVMSKKLDLIAHWLAVIDKGEDLLRGHASANAEYWADDVTLLFLLKGLCLKHLGRYLMAEHYFNCVLQREKLLKHDHYLVPYTHYELGVLYYLKGDYANAAKSLDNIKNYRDYSMESQLQFRAHVAFEQIYKEL
ncbi:tetratricopeptide repeat protein 39B-like [Suncus etruscus]|uniref:tetratricopeptide repeat protein 39B-like n=1 Tax=Suncus etruscus TaxID=109475 RepID=UPI0021109D7B|nr:tetratricopeptide repeat protein 39B-like [Suncus etruscus]